MPHLTLLLILFLSACASAVPEASSATPEDESTLSYALTPVPLGDRTDLVVTLRFVGDADGVTRLSLPNCKYGTPRMWESITALSAENGTLAHVDSQPWLRDVHHSAKATICITYTVSREASQDEGVAYRPATDPTRFYFFDSQWRCQLPERDDPQTLSLAFERIPVEWLVFSNLGDGPGPYEVELSTGNVSAFVAGGLYDTDHFEVAGTSVRVYVEPDFTRSAEIVDSVRAIVRHQVAEFGGFLSDFYVVSLSARADITAGTRIENAFVCLVDSEVSSTRLDLLVAHEVFHNWLPGVAAITSWKEGEAIDEFRFDWFIEGFTEYTARRLLLQQGAFDMDDFVACFNRDLAEQERSSASRASLDAVSRALDQGVFSNYHERTSYVRGPLMALAWDTQLRRAGEHTILDVVRAILSEGAAAGGCLDEHDFFALLERYGIDGRSDYRRHIVYGNPLLPAADTFGPDFAFKPSSVPSYDLGFDGIGSRRASVLCGVTLDGPAYAAGLRDGMVLVSVLSKRTLDRASVVVQIDGKPTTFDYAPAGGHLKSGRFVRSR